MISNLLLDTHVAWWLGYQPEKLSQAAAEAIRFAYAQGDRMALSAASVYELTWLLQRGRLSTTDQPGKFLGELRRLFLIVPIDGTIAERAALISAPFHGDPMDRIIATTALETGRTLITADRMILESGVCPVCW